jgi:hypothetical protein
MDPVTYTTSGGANAASSAVGLSDHQRLVVNDDPVFADAAVALGYRSVALSEESPDGPPSPRSPAPGELPRPALTCLVDPLDNPHIELEP